MHSTRLFATLSFLVGLVFLAPTILLAQYDISTVAGGGPNNVAALGASIGYPGSIARDAAGNTYIADSYSSQIFEVATTGNVTVVAGNGTRGYSGDGGPATSAALSGPEGVFVDASGNIFIADTENSVIREVTASNGNIATVAGNGSAGYSGDNGLAVNAQLDDPYGVFVDGSGNIYIADTDNAVIREVVSGTIETVAGNGTICPDPTTLCGDGGAATGAEGAELGFPEGVFVVSGNIFIADTDDSRIRVVNTGAASVTVAGVVIPVGDIQTVAGAYYQAEGGTACQSTGDGGSPLSAYLCAPSAVFVDGTLNIFVADWGNSAIREIASSGTDITTVAGTLGAFGYTGDGGLATIATLNYPNDVVVDGSGNIFIADTNNFVVREVAASDIQTIIGNNTLAYSGDGGLAVDAALNYPGGASVDGSGNIFIADSLNSVIREVVATSGDIRTVAGNGVDCAEATAACGDGGLASNAQFSDPNGVFLDGTGNVFIADTFDNRIRLVNTGASSITVAGVTIAPGDVATVAGTGQQGYQGNGNAGTSAALFSPSGVFVDGSENIFIADTDNHAIREVTASSGIITTVAGTGQPCPAPTTGPCGDGGLATSAQLNFPRGVFLDSSGNIYIADSGNNRVRVVNTGTSTITIAGVAIQPGNIGTVAGTGAEGYSGDGAAAVSATLAGPSDIFIDSTGDIFITDAANFVIREVLSASGFIATVAGNNTQGFSGDGGQSTGAQFNTATGLYGDSNGNLFIADTDNSRIRKLTPAAPVAPVAAAPAPQSTSPGGTATFSIELTKDTGDPRYAITLSCLQSTLPANAACSFSPAKITPGPLPVPFTLTVTVPSGSAAEKNADATRLQFSFAVALLPLAGMWFAGVGLRNGRRRWLLLALLGGCLVLLNACGGGSSGSTGSTTYSIQVQGTTSAQPSPVTITTATLTVQ